MSKQGDPLFGGMTRPPLMLGLPPAALAGVMVLPIAILLFTRFIPIIALVPVNYVIARTICAKDPRQFRYIGLYLRTHRTGRNRKLWGGNSSYAPRHNRK